MTLRLGGQTCPAGAGVCRRQVSLPAARSPSWCRRGPQSRACPAGDIRSSLGRRKDLGGRPARGFRVWPDGNYKALAKLTFVSLLPLLSLSSSCPGKSPSPILNSVAGYETAADPALPSRSKTLVGNMSPTETRHSASAQGGAGPSVARENEQGLPTRPK